MRQYIALIYKAADSNYGVLFPDLPGVVTAGRTLDEARDMAVEALAFHLEDLVTAGKAQPAPSSFDDIMSMAHSRNGVAIFVPAPAPEVKTVRVNLTFPADVLSEIDTYAERLGFTRAGFLAQAAKKLMTA